MPLKTCWGWIHTPGASLTRASSGITVTATDIQNLSGNMTFHKDPLFANRFHCDHHPRENVATTVGILFDGVKGTLAYYKDGACLGIAFTGLCKVKEALYPIVCSTAAKSGMALGVMKREYTSLQVPS